MRMTPTRKQLELAAKAAGIKGFAGARGFWFIAEQRYWKPVTDKSDSRDLMVACEIELAFGDEEEVQAFGGNNSYAFAKIEDYNNDKGLATCAAVFLCAVEIGRSL